MGFALVLTTGAKTLKLLAKSWSSGFSSRREKPARRPAGLRRGLDATAPERVRDLKSEAEGTVHEQHPAKAYAKGIIALFRNTTLEWMEDRCPQLGASLAYFTIFSLAPLILVLLAVFGFVFGSSDQAREKITEQLQYFIDPNGIKVIKDIAVRVARPTSSILATSLGIIVAFFGASGVFGQLQEALNTIWGVKLKRGSGLWVLYGRGFFHSRWSPEFVFCSCCP
jgi:hypothetical protein